MLKRIEIKLELLNQKSADIIKKFCEFSYYFVSTLKYFKKF